MTTTGQIVSTKTQAILSAFNLNEAECNITCITNGLINHTSLLELQNSHKKYILQRLNTNVFKSPLHIAQNIRSIADYLSIHHPEYLLPAPIKTIDGGEYFYDEENGNYRLIPYINGSHTLNVVDNPTQAFEAARQFGRFTRMLEGFDPTKLHITLKDFHNLSLRFEQFQNAMIHGNKNRIDQCRPLIDFLNDQVAIVGHYQSLLHHPSFMTRVTHHDTKISNVLFDQHGKGICVIDLDTVMPGFFISDVGDMMRTYLSPVNEEEGDFTKIQIREEFFTAIVKGYLDEMNDQLTQSEKKNFVFAGKFMIYMQALRFLTDHLNNDVYYGAKYEGHNLLRAQNQAVLLQKLFEKEDELNKITAQLV